MRHKVHWSGDSVRSSFKSNFPSFFHRFFWCSSVIFNDFQEKREKTELIRSSKIQEKSSKILTVQLSTNQRWRIWISWNRQRQKIRYSNGGRWSMLYEIWSTCNWDQYLIWFIKQYEIDSYLWLFLFSAYFRMTFLNSNETKDTWSSGHRPCKKLRFEEFSIFFSGFIDPNCEDKTQTYI